MSQSSNPYIKIVGIISDSSFRLISKGLHRTSASKSYLDLFCAYSDFEIPVGIEFFYWHDKKCGTSTPLKAKLIDVTQQMAITFDSIPKGWKTISRFIIDEAGIKLVKSEIPVVDDWWEFSGDFYLSVDAAAPDIPPIDWDS